MASVSLALASDRHYTFIMKKLKHAMLSIVFIIVGSAGAVFPQSATPVHGTKIDSLQSIGFDIPIGELSKLLDFQRSLFLDPTAKVNTDWNDKFDELYVSEISSTANRYAYAIDSDQGNQFISIRGTANLRNALLDLEYWKSRSAILGINLHRGFEKAALAVFSDLEPRIKRDMPIIVSGHSLGAAEAIIVGMLLVKKGYNVEMVVASGLPKVTDEEGWKQYKSLPVIRIVAAYDFVPFLPPHNFYPASPYTQGGPLLMMLDGPYLAIADPSYFDDIPAASEIIGQIDAHFDVIDHRIWTYCDRAKEKLGGMEIVPFKDWTKYALPRGDSSDAPPK